MKTSRALLEIAKPIFLDRKNCAVLALSMLALSLSQGLILIFANAFVKSFFIGDTASSTIQLTSLFPKNIQHVLPADLNVSREFAILFVPAALVLISAIRSVSNFLFTFFHAKISLLISLELRMRILNNLLGQPYLQIAERSPGSWMSSIMNDVNLVENRFTDMLATLLRSVFTVVTSLIALFFFHWPSAVVLFLLAPVLSFILGRSGKAIAKFTEFFQREMARISSAILDIRARFAFVKAQHAENTELHRFDQMNQNYLANMRKSLGIRSLVGPLLEFVGFACLAIFIFLQHRPGHSEIVSGDIAVLFFAALGNAMRPLRDIGEQVAGLQETRGALASFQHLIETKSEIHAEQNKTSLEEFKLPFTIPTLRVSYHGKSALRLNSLLIEKSSVAIIGRSGSGKSTFARTLAGIIHAEVQEHGLQDIRSQASFVSQSPFLFSGTIRENLLYRSNQSVTDQEIFEALRVVELENEVKQFDRGLDTNFAALADRISGGQKQRLTIARALLRKRKVLLLDEATSAVDSNSDRAITSHIIAFQKKLGGTVLSVTHRFEWLDQYEKVFFLDEGNLIFEGSVSELKKQPRFLELSQSL